MTDIAFLHVPKCAGLSINAQLATRYPADAFCPFNFDTNLNENLADFALIARRMRRRIFDERFGHTVTGSLKRYPVITGHFHLDTFLQVEPAMIITFLREPRARLLSHYNFWRSWADGMYTTADPNGGVRRLRERSFLEFLSEPEYLSSVDNLAARLLLPRTMVPLDESLSPSLIDGQWDSIVAQLEQITYIGLTETVDYDMKAAGLSSGAPIPRENQTSRRSEGLAPAGPLEGAAVDHALENATWLDRRIYLWAEGVRTSRGAPPAPDPDVSWALARARME